ncbi:MULTISPECIES: exopolysaccharide production repressor exox [unclassified Mesorhizobium]|uniref:exopolysaccharide production repressor exox n=1 Tax=unclassified Mesorhizobium TaxID=325217 RepID=UPI000F758F71|nr:MULTISPECIES: exopolysaccharide production repressor exox [unclassified Mesorhizobium]TGT60834.1 exopolysaccharide production repressor exox [Mesorhizobium sp. M00.F.Ca.ET.170.01.1.1]AZO10066.1 exopolysaccharide production repressor exox [Mesorhizobium sp. M3A.F.Ca.ET.080.04.2.1]RWB75752.1 MAG: exopolysaccharide production repressor exox [Mesorhizobium sp.]RWB91504.1 MAG: exopolysaccharide production repressor exox [Mesorhizobium sp.]RWE21259.1 MAG: exopolysaccharide production repressor ex
MSLPKFMIGMTFALAIVIGWSYVGGASAGTIVVRTIIGGLVIQAGYILLVYAMIARSTPTPADKVRGAERRLVLDEPAKAEKP